MHYRTHCCEHHKPIKLSRQSDGGFLSGLIEDYIRNVFEERKVSEAQREALWEYYYQQLSSAVDLGYAPTLEHYSEDLALSLKRNIAEFSAFKETSFRKQLEASLSENGRVLSWKEFKQKAEALNIEYNHRWLKTEYDQTIATATQAGKYQEYLENKHLYPNLKYKTIGDHRVREKHKQWDELILPVEHPFWKTHLPPNDWGCRCYVVPTDEEPNREIQNDTPLKETFANNPALNGKIFPTSGYLTFGGLSPETIEKIIDWSHEMFKRAERYAKNYASYLKYKRNKDYTNVLFDKKTGGMQATHKLHNFDDVGGTYEKYVQKIGYKYGNSVILDIEIHNIHKLKNTDGYWNGLKMEIAGTETGTANNIRNGLKHCASKKTTEVAVLYFPNNNFSKTIFEEGLAKYNGLWKDPKQFKKFKKIICISDGKIVYQKSH
ncbi:phage head morphogenesis protein [Ornithobacterium rhinotracheale]|uniref:Phage head morphogenesis protein n=1 Tax=Ornithobacterium rhinotracheale TaxID=28251 RepID=A0A410JSL6_ORNRH|nr:phage minor head protein [Ornithobacterium rhinotracheale]QAR31133.1 phage head morphogenesis protein [Ornithobacterium rhinotracheale]